MEQTYLIGWETLKNLRKRNLRYSDGTIRFRGTCLRFRGTCRWIVVILDLEYLFPEYETKSVVLY